MTQEEKAKAYDEAIKVVKPLYEQAKKDDCPIWSTYETIFPELTESEDERIRNTIIDALYSHTNSINLLSSRGYQMEDIEAWLERQKETIHISENGMLAWLKKQEEEERYDAIPVESTLEYKLGFKAGKDSEKQKEPHKRLRDKTPWTVIAKEELAHDEERLQANLEELRKIRAEKEKQKEQNTDKCQGCNNVKGCINCVDGDQWAHIEEQKPAEWSEEDEKMLSKIIKHFDWYDSDRFNAEDCKEAQDFLKSLRPQPKKELSIEKAINWLDDTFYFLDNSSGRGRDCEITTHDFDSLEEMYDSFRKAVIVDSEPHWKPSEEQMRILNWTANGMVDNSIAAPEMRLVLRSLYNDLKKLKENK